MTEKMTNLYEPLDEFKNLLCQWDGCPELAIPWGLITSDKRPPEEASPSEAMGFCTSSHLEKWVIAYNRGKVYPPFNARRKKAHRNGTHSLYDLMGVIESV